MFDKEKSFTNKEVTNYLLNLYVVLSLVFICITLYTNVRVQYGNYMYNNGVQAGINQGGEVAYKQAFTEVYEKSKVCEPFTIGIGEENAVLINIDCLQPAQTGTNTQAPITGEAQQITDTPAIETVQ